MGAGFLSLRVEIPAFWLERRRNPQEGSTKNAKGHSNMVGAIYSTGENVFLWSSPIYANPAGHLETLYQ
jgi:hypothetical protein